MIWSASIHALCLLGTSKPEVGLMSLPITSEGCKIVIGMSILKVQSSYLHCAKTCILLIIESYGITEVS